MANKKFWWGIPVLVFGMTVIGCDRDNLEGTEKFDNNAVVTVHNDTSTTYYITRNVDENHISWTTMEPDKSVNCHVNWNGNGSGVTTVYLTTDKTSNNRRSRTYYLTKDERRTINISSF